MKRGRNNVRMRIHGEDKPFADWVRNHEDLESHPPVGFTQTDIDVLVHRYWTEVDGMGSRDIQCLMHIETKTRNGFPSRSQADTLAKLDLHACKTRHEAKAFNGLVVHWWGCFFLRMTGTAPDNSKEMFWGGFPALESTSCPNCNQETLRTAHECKCGFMFSGPEIRWRLIDAEMLLALLRFEIDPVNFVPLSYRRHKKKGQPVIVVEEQMPLGFSVDRCVQRKP